MWSCARQCVNHVKTLATPILTGANDLTLQHTRNTYILKRMFPPGLYKKNGRQGKFKHRHFIYEVVEQIDSKKRVPLEVILVEDVAGLGVKGQRVKMSPMKAYSTLLLPKLAVYATPENIAKYCDDTREGVKKWSSFTVPRTIDYLSGTIVSVVMSLDVPWVLEKWHVRASCRKAGIVVPDDAITMPPHTISGPDLSMENKEFYVTITINNHEEVKLRCRIHHWTPDVSRQLPHKPEHWKYLSEPIFPEDKPILDAMPKHKLCIEQTL